MLIDLIHHLGFKPCRLLRQGLPATALNQRAFPIGQHAGGWVYRLAAGGHAAEIDEGAPRKLKDGCPLIFLPATGQEDESVASIAARGLLKLQEMRQAAKPLPADTHIVPAELPKAA